MTTRTLCFALCSLVVSVAGAAGAAAQDLTEPEARQGYYLAAGARSSVSVADDDDVGSLGAGGGGEAVIRIGQMLTPRFGVGLSVAGGIARSSEWNRRGGGVVVEGQIKPLAGVDLAVRGGIGLGIRAVSRRDAAAETDDDPSGIFGSLYSLGVSHDWFVTRGRRGSGGLAITAAADATALAGDGIVDLGMVVGVELTYWAGLPESQLALPVAEGY
jgi:hypothetical protein